MTKPLIIDQDGNPVQDIARPEDVRQPEVLFGYIITGATVFNMDCGPDCQICNLRYERKGNEPYRGQSGILRIVPTKTGVLLDPEPKPALPRGITVAPKNQHLAGVMAKANRNLLKPKKR